jgi:hypothetical protein
MQKGKTKFRNISLYVEISSLGQIGSFAWFRVTN